jgi:hypothetical protein
MTATPPPGSPHRNASTLVDVASAPKHESPWRKRGLITLIALATVGLAYGIGRLQGALALRNAEEKHASELGAFKSDLSTCDRERGLLSARRSLSLVALDLDRRNFGVAETHRKEAMQALEQRALGALPGVAGIAATIRSLDLSVNPDPGETRNQVIAATEALDRIELPRSDDRPSAASSSQVP